jgi:thiamine biosynthesis lipoprotein
MELDFGAIAKGYGVDLVAQLLKERGCVHYFVEIGGEIRTAGVNPDGSEWRVGIERPQENARALKAVLQLSDQGMATSGNYRNFYYEDGKRYAHTIDPKTGYPVDHQLLSATVVADECMTADAYATAFMVMGREAGQRLLKERPDLQAYFIYGDEQGGLATYATPQLKRKVETIPEQGKEAS